MRPVPTPRPGRCRGDAGQVAGVEALPFGVLTFVIGTLLVVNCWGVVDAKLAATSAAREAVRAYVEAPDEATALASAEEAARATMAGHGRSTERTTVEVLAADGRAFGRCARITVVVRHPMPAIRLPLLGGYGHAYDVVARQSEVVDPYRSGLPGEASC
jgi:hypothetical protein